MPCGLLQASPWSRPPRRRQSTDHLSITWKEAKMSDANDEYVYDEASGEWLPAAEAAAKAAAADLVEVRDSAGNVLADGDSVITIKDLKRSEEHTSELQSLMRISYAVFCLKK